jgi:hypothetical protein
MSARRDGVGVGLQFYTLNYTLFRFPTDISNNQLMLASAMTRSLANSGPLTPDTRALSNQRHVEHRLVVSSATNKIWPSRLCRFNTLSMKRDGCLFTGDKFINSIIQQRTAKDPAFHCFTERQHPRTYDSQGRFHFTRSDDQRPGTGPLTPIHRNKPW